MFRIFNRYQAAEYNTAVARARTGKQWDTFMGDDNRRLFPSIQWLPSRSANPREEHMPFYYKIWAKDDPFWTTKFPGNLWNCKCDWEETDDDPTDDNPQGPAARPGLDLNPATSGQIFTDTNLYVAKAPAGTDKVINAFGRKMVKERFQDTRHATTEKGDVSITKKTIKEALQTYTDDKGYWLKNELLEHLDEHLPSFNYVGAEEIDLSHNKKDSRAYRVKEKAKQMLVFKKTMADYEFTCKVLEFEDGSLLAYTLT